MGDLRVDRPDAGISIDPLVPSEDIYVIGVESEDTKLPPTDRPAKRELRSVRPSHIRLDIQGMRAIAVVAVVIYHAGPYLPGGFVGVDIFFVISGFVIAGVLRRLVESSPTPLRHFYGRRVRRLMPPATLMVATTLIVGLFLVPFGLHLSVARSALAATLLSSNLWFTLSGSNYFSPGTGNDPLLHTWSLGVEEQFYLIVPLLFVLLHKADRRWSTSNFRILPIVLGSIGVASLVLCLLTTSRPGGVGVPPYVPSFAEIAFYSSPTRAWEFLAGFLVSTAVLRVHRRLVLALRLSAILTLVACFAFYTDAMSFPGWRAILPVAATVGLLLAGTADGGRSRILSSSPMVMVGDLSYGLYLWHWPALVLCRFALQEGPMVVPVALVCTFAIALLSYKTLEVPFRRASAISIRWSAGLAVICTAVPIALAVGLLAVSPSLQSARGITFTSRFEYAGARKLDCVDDGAHRDWNRDLCRWSIAGRPSVFLVGDSHAWALSTTVAEAAQRSGLGFEVWSHFGCPFSTAVAVDEPGCASWQTSVLETILRERPGLVVIANRSPTYTRAPGENFDVKLPDRPLARNEDEALAVWDEGLRAVVEPLADAGIPMLLISTVPEFPDKPLVRVSFLRPDGDLDPQPLSVVDLRRGRVVLVEQAVAASTPGLEIFDPVPYLCDTLCRQFDGTSWHYYDDDHLTPDGADRLRRPLEASIRRLAIS